jgi:NNP family nitrate/nitrite transporter-like MFS transporter
MKGQGTVAIPFPLRPVLLLVMIFYLNFVSRVVIAPLLPVVEGEFDLGHAEAGFLFLIVAAGYCTGLFGSPFISSRLNHRRTIVLSATTVGAAMLALSQSISVSTMHAGLFGVGICTGLYLPSGIAMVTDLVSKEHWGKAIAIHELAPNLAFITAPLLVELLLRFIGWRSIIGTLGVSSILAALLFFVFGRGGGQKGDPPNPKAMQKVLGSASFWITAAVFILCIGGSLGVYTMLPLFLVNEVGMERELANTLIGVSRAFALLILLFAGVIIDWIGRKQATVVFLTIMGALTLLLGLLHGPVIKVILVFVQPAAAVSIFPAVFAMVSHIFPSSLRSLAMSLVGLVGFLLGGGLIPQAIGYLAEVSSFSYGFSLMGVLALAALPLLYFLREA